MFEVFSLAELLTATPAMKEFGTICLYKPATGATGVLSEGPNAGTNQQWSGG